jgi:hypothetical protein
MINIDSSIDIYRPVNYVFDFISSSANDFEWKYGTLASGQVSEGATRLGSFFRSIGHLMGHRMQSTFEITEYEANRKYGYKSLSGPLHSQTLCTLESANGHTKMRVSTHASPARLLTVQESTLEKHMQKQLKDDLVLLKSILEAPG